MQGSEPQVIDRKMVGEFVSSFIRQLKFKREDFSPLESGPIGLGVSKSEHNAGVSDSATNAEINTETAMFQGRPPLHLKKADQPMNPLSGNRCFPADRTIKTKLLARYPH